ncbi:MAG: N-acetyltransferase [Chloroflexia bacterium]|nr:N-acetyltransferase [Chloroflexia bacterium]
MEVSYHFTVLPLCFNDIAAIENGALWGQPRVNISPNHKGIGAIAEDGTLVGYCGFYDQPRGAEVRIGALQSRMPGVGAALLNTLKARFYYLIAEHVLVSAAGWWERRGFVLLHSATEDDEEGVIGTYEWWRDDDPVFAEAPYESVWPNHRSLAQLIWDEQKRQQAVDGTAQVVRR